MSENLIHLLNKGDNIALGRHKGLPLPHVLTLLNLRFLGILFTRASIGQSLSTHLVGYSYSVAITHQSPVWLASDH
jgi:hypothetical protein